MQTVHFKRFKKVKIMEVILFVPKIEINVFSIFFVMEWEQWGLQSEKIFSKSIDFSLLKNKRNSIFMHTTYYAGFEF